MAMRPLAASGGEAHGHDALVLRRALLLVALGGAGACGDDGAAPAPTEQPEDFLSELALAVPDDADPDPNVLEVTIRAGTEEVELVSGKATQIWSYGALPGPLLHLTQGDRLVVHFENDLPKDSSIHWHGIRLPVDMDGSPHSQAPVAPGETFTYDFVVPDPGVYYYHPHVFDAEEMGAGLYGALIVDPKEPAAEDLGDPVVLVLSDMSINEDGELAPPDQGGNLATLFGREGAVVLVNGKVRPTMHARNGRRQRWQLINAARSRYFQLSLGEERLLRVGGQAGLSGDPIEMGSFVIAPGERVEVLVTPTGEPGAREELVWTPYDRGYGSTEFREPETIMDVELVGEAIESAPLPAAWPAAPEPLSTAGAEEVDIQLTQSMSGGDLVLGIDGVPFETSIPAAVGETQRWRVTNTMQWDHPFHLHGFFFQVLNEDGTPKTPVEWRDTVNVPQMESVSFVVKYDNRPGDWMFHCHILDHADAGMSGFVTLMK